MAAANNAALVGLVAASAKHEKDPSCAIVWIPISRCSIG
jgi:hypothetical protein